MASTVEFRSIAKVVALVTGGASGLGRATAVRLAAQVMENNISGSSVIHVAQFLIIIKH